VRVLCFQRLRRSLGNKDEDEISPKHCLRAKPEFARGLCIKDIVSLNDEISKIAPAIYAVSENIKPEYYMDFLKKTAKNILRWEAKLVLKKYKPKIIAITGSVGKTLTREAVYLVLSKRFFVRRSEKSFTAELGIPLTIIGSPYGMTTWFDLIQAGFFALKIIVIKSAYPKWLILELDGDKPGDLSGLSYLNIDILVMTVMGEVPVHTEAFRDIEALLFEQRSIMASMKKDGVIIYNADDLRTVNLLQDREGRKVSCGIGKVFDVGGSDFEIIYNDEKYTTPTGMSFDIISEKDLYGVTSQGSIGVQNEYSSLLAFAVGLEFGLQPSVITASLNKNRSLPGRMNFIPGLKDSIIIDDSYNSSPVAMFQAMSVLSRLKSSGRKIAIIGDMLELGKYSADEHRKIAEQIKDSASFVICVGLRAKKILEELINLGFGQSNIISVDSSVEAGKELQKILQAGDMILVKGSQAMRMEKVVEEVMMCPEDKNRLLVRQEKEWLNR